MTELDIGAAIQQTPVTDLQIASQTTDGSGEEEIFHYNNEFNSRYGKYRKISKVRIPINAFSTWSGGLGWTASDRDTVILNSIRGAGEDTFDSILWNMRVIKKVNGQSFSHIVRNEETGTLLNVKPLDPSSVVSVSRKGIIIRYEQISKNEGVKNIVIEVKDMLHFINDRVADDMVGVSVIDSLTWNIEAQEEARHMLRRKIKNSGIIGLIEQDSQDTTEIKTMDAAILKGMENGTFMKFPKGVVEVKEWAAKLNIQETLLWLNYLDDEFFMEIGLPKVILGGSSENEGDKKMSYLSFEPNYKRQINEEEADILNQLGVEIEFNLPPSLQNQLADNELKNTSQVGLQPNDTIAGRGE